MATFSREAFYDDPPMCRRTMVQAVSQYLIAIL
jgi:hypothetical protein